MQPTDSKVAAYADQIMREVEDDIAEGTVPVGVGTFTDLHSYLDANDYLEAAGMPYYDTQAAIDLTIAVQDEVTRRLRTPGRPFCTFGTCSFSTHDHTTLVGPDGEQLATPVPMRCHHCHQPAHYDTRLESYRHDDPAVPDCFLIRRGPR